MAYNQTQSEYARARGVSPARINQYIKNGQLTGSYKKVGKKIYLDPKKADAKLAGSLDPMLPHKGNDTPIQELPKKTPQQKAIEKAETDFEEKVEKVNKSGVKKLDYHGAKTFNEQYKAAMNKVLYEAKIKELIPAKEVKKRCFNIARQARDALLTIADRCAPLVAAETEQFQCRKILMDEIKHILENLANAVESE